MGVLKNGNPRGRGAPGYGRTPNWVKYVCENELKRDKYKGLLLIGKISRGEARFEKAFQHNGEIIKATLGPTPQEIIDANEFLWDRAYGKPTQSVEVGDNLSEILLGMADRMRESRVRSNGTHTKTG